MWFCFFSSSVRRGLSSAPAAAAEPFLFAASPDEPEVWLGEADISSLVFSFLLLLRDVAARYGGLEEGLWVMR
jgi:hypothetical protein